MTRERSTWAKARRNADMFADELDLPGGLVEWEPNGKPDATYWPMRFSFGERSVDIMVPGLECKKNILIRLVVDGSSWQWGYALEQARDILNPKDRVAADVHQVRDALVNTSDIEAFDRLLEHFGWEDPE